ncbi:MAG: hypothetical protein WD066_05555 [Planctomycetaceae bacterium]
MCYLLTIAVPRDAAEQVVRNARRGFMLGKPGYQLVEAVFPPDFESFDLTSGCCSCGMYNPRREAVDARSRRDHLRAKYEKRGWSEAKIRRAIEQAMSKPEPETFVGLRPDIARTLAGWARVVGEIGVLVHFYDEESRIVVRGTQRIAADRLETTGCELDEDILLWVEG